MAIEDKLNLGKKIFFVNPPFDLQKLVMPLLSISEFEVYSVVNYQYTKAILQLYPDSICFVCIDSGITMNEWENFVITLSNDDTLKNVCFGVLSAYASSTDKAHLLLNANIPAGFISLNDNKEDLAEKIEKILLLNEARGVRKFIRVNCNRNRKTFIQYKINDQPLAFAIQDISSAGFLCAASLKYKPFFTENMLLRNIDIHLMTTKITCNAVVLRTFEKDGLLFIAMLFTKGLPYTAKLAIQTFIQYFLQSNMNAKILTLEKDTTDYSKHITKTDNDDAFLIAVEEDNVIYADDVQEDIVFADDLYEDDVKLIDDTI